MPEGMRSDVLVPDGRTARCCGRGVAFDEVLNGVGGQPPPGSGREQRILGVAGLLAEPGADYGGDVRGEWGDAVLSPLAVAADGRPGPGLDVVAGEAGELVGPQPGLGGEGEKGVVSAAVPGPGVRGGEQCRDFVGGEVGDGSPAVLLRGDREDPGDRP